MLLDKDAVIAAINALPDATPVAGGTDPLQTQLDEANAKVADLEKKNSDLAAQAADVATQLSALQTKESAEAATLLKVKEDVAGV